jgi:hypothetical protein
VRITAGWSLRHHPDQAARAEPGSEADELTAELTASYWRAHDRRLAETGFLAIALFSSIAGTPGTAACC